jgi:type VI secretion system protein ImpA
MPSADVLTFEALLEPIPGPSPAGVDLRVDLSPTSLYQLIKEDRKSARQTETRIDRRDPDVTQAPDWRPLVERATRVLREQSKDLEVAAYLIEGLVRVEGFAGLRDGYRLASELVDRFWDQRLYPAPDEPDIESRFAHMLQLNGLDAAGALVVPIAKIPLTEQTPSGEYSRAQHQEATTLAKMADGRVRQARIDAGATTLETIQKAVAETSTEFYITLFDDLAAAEREFLRFCEVFKAKSGYDPPAASIREALESTRLLLKDLTRSRQLQKAPVTPNVEASQDGSAPSTEKSMSNGQIASRDAALEQLLKIAAFFRQSEPQSVIPYALEQVVHWGRLSLPELLSELISEEGTRKSVFKQVGIAPSKPS